MRSCFFAVLMCICTYVSAQTDNAVSDNKNFPLLLTKNAEASLLQHLSDSIYNLIGLNNYGLEKEAFFYACKGYQYLISKGSIRKKNILTICDYSQSGNNKRLYVIDLLNNTVLFNTFVSHGKNSGDEFATSFSNVDNSNKSSLGFLVTDDTYRGVAGYSLRFNGMEAGINDHVRSRYIVLHGSKFVNEEVVEARGRIGRSLGCPAVPLESRTEIIDAIKGGSCFYIYNPAPWYTHTSRILNAKLEDSPSKLSTIRQRNSPEPLVSLTK
ncbi:MAG: hypothetical protein JWR18_1454 [Segetibacter sp.]|jgi:hypothetical protein|nr:hypothetical protein [Segetibacter sp.]